MKTKHRADRRSRVQHTAAQRQEQVRGWRLSGLTQAEYCARRGIHPTTFSTWCRTAAREATGKSRPKGGVEFAEFKMAVGGLLPIEVELPNRVRIRLRDAAICRELLPLLRGEEAC